MTSAVLAWIDRHARSLLWTIAGAALVTRALLAAFSPHAFGYVWDFYLEGITYLYHTGHLPASTTCAQCYQPPLFFYVGLPFYAFGQFLYPQSFWPNDRALWAVEAVPLASGFACLIYIYRLLRLFRQRGAALVFGAALAAAFPCLFTSSFSLEADILLAALLSAFTFYLTRWFVHPAGRTWRAMIGLGVLAGLSAATKYSGLVAVVSAMPVFALAWWRGGARSRLVGQAGAFLVVAAALGSWKYVDNTRLYGTPFFANGSAAEGFNLLRRTRGARYEFTTFRLRELVALTRPDAPPGMLTVMPVYNSVWTTLHGLGWGEMGFFTNPTRHGTAYPFYHDRHVAPWLASAVLVLGMLPDVLAVIGVAISLRRAVVWPVALVSLVGSVAYLLWMLPQTWWAIKTKYLLMLFPAYVLYAVFGLRWLCRAMPAWMNAAVLAWLVALILLANAYLVSFAIG